MRLRSLNKRQARILVVDDERMAALTLGAVLQKHGYEVAMASSGEEAVEKATTFAPDLLISDFCVGVMSGVEAASRITAKLPDCKVLFLSGRASMIDILIAAPERLVYSFTSKPLHSLDLLNAIGYMLSAFSAAGDTTVMAAEQDGVQRYGMGGVPAKAGFILKEAGTGFAPIAVAQSKPDAVFFDMSIPDTAAHPMRLQ